MLDGLGSRQNAKLVLGDLPWDTRHVGRLPGKSVLVCAEEVDEREFLFGGQLGPDTDRLGWVIIVDRDWLGFLGRDESRSLAGLARVGATLGRGGTEPVEFRRVRHGGGEIVVLTAADVGLLEGAAHGDDPVWARHLELEVGVVGHRHELGIGGAPKNGMIHPLLVHHLEREGLGAELRFDAKRDR